MLTYTSNKTCYLMVTPEVPKVPSTRVFATEPSSTTNTSTFHQYNIAILPSYTVSNIIGMKNIIRWPYYQTTVGINGKKLLLSERNCGQNAKMV